MKSLLTSLGASRAAWLATAGVVAVAAAAVTLPYVHTVTTADAAPQQQTTVVSGSSSSAASSSASSNGGNNGKADPPSKDFTIFGTMSDQMFPGYATHLAVSINNPNNQAVRLYSLKVSVTSITKAAGRTGPCNSSSLDVGDWTAASFTLAANSPATPVPGYIPVSLKLSADTDCQGAVFNLSYSGKAEKG